MVRLLLHCKDNFNLTVIIACVSVWNKCISKKKKEEKMVTDTDNTQYPLVPETALMLKI